MPGRENHSRKRGCKYWLRLLAVGLIGGILAAGVVVELIYIITITRPAPGLIGEPPGGEYQAVSLFNEKDNIRLSGWYIPSKNGAAIILLHGFDGDRLDMLSRAQALARSGYGVLLYDLRGHGESGGEVRAFGWQDVEDVGAALDFLSNREDVDPDRIGILGFSIGGQIAIRAAAEYEQIKAILADDPGFVTVDDAPPPANVKQKFIYLVSWIDGRCVSLWTGIPIPPGVPGALSHISPRPIMFIDTGQAEGRALIRYYFEIADEPKELWEIPEANHGAQFMARPLEYEERMVTFFNNALLKK
jgi:uncharacterized protein